MEEDKDKSVESDKRGWSEIVRELTATGLAAVFMTEDSVRSYLKDKKLPKEMISALMEGLSRKKDDVYGVMAKEFGRVLSKIDLTAEVTKFLERHHVHVSAKFSFEPKDETNGNQGS